MRIGIDALALRTTSSVPNAGLSRTVDMLIEALLRRAPKHHFTIYMWPTEPEPRWSGCDNVRIHRVWRKPRYWRILGRDFDAIRHRLDVYLNLAGAVPFLPATFRAALMHDLFPLTNPEWLLPRDVRFLTREIRVNRRCAQHYFANSHSTKESLVTFGFPEGRITVTGLGPGNIETPIPHGSLTPEQRRSLAIPFDRYLFTLSTIEPRKNLVRLLQAFAEVVRDPVADGLGLVVAGGRGWKEAAVDERVAELGLQDRVLFLGYVDSASIPALFAGCEFYVLPAVTEGFGMTVLEAMLYGVPIVCSRGGAIPEVSGDAARYFDPLDHHDIARALRESLRDRGWHPQAIAMGHERARLFTWDKAADTILATLEAKVGPR